MKREEEEEGVGTGTDGDGSKSERGGEGEEGRERWPPRRPEESEGDVEARWRREARAAPEMERSEGGGGGVSIEERLELFRGLDNLMGRDKENLGLIESRGSSN